MNRYFIQQIGPRMLNLNGLYEVIHTVDETHHVCKLIKTGTQAECSKRLVELSKQNEQTKIS